jgi:hypothetical protein
MMEHYVTLFDRAFIPQALALYASMDKHIPKYKLWMICVDIKAYSAMQKLGLANAHPLLLSEIETDELLHVKAERTPREYCWTLTPFAPRFVFEADRSINRVTYVDADLSFLANPQCIFQEFARSGKSVLITDHAYASENDATASSGKYCVQFMTFVRDTSEIVRKDWEDKCIEWCFARYENGRFGDQKYLEDWPINFPDQVHVLEKVDAALAPWNATRFPYSSGIFWHFQGLRLNRLYNKTIEVNLGPYSLPPVVRECVYVPYIEALAAAVELMQSHGLEVQSQQSAVPSIFVRVRQVLTRIFMQRWRFRTNVCMKVRLRNT